MSARLKALERNERRRAARLAQWWQFRLKHEGDKIAEERKRILIQFDEGEKVTYPTQEKLDETWQTEEDASR